MKRTVHKNSGVLVFIPTVALHPISTLSVLVTLIAIIFVSILLIDPFLCSHCWIYAHVIRCKLVILVHVW